MERIMKIVDKIFDAPGELIEKKLNKKKAEEKKE